MTCALPEREHVLIWLWSGDDRATTKISTYATKQVKYTRVDGENTKPVCV